MKLVLPLTLPIALLLAFGAGVLFWALVSQLRWASYFRNAADRPPPLEMHGWIAFYKRTLIGAYVLLWWSVRAAFQTGLRQPPGKVRGRPVLCIHGLFMNSTCMWGIRRRLEDRGRPTRGVFMGTPLPTPLAYAEPLAKAMRSLARATVDEGFDIVAHSIGGVMVREVLHREPGLADSVRRIVTLGSPHHGTAVLRWIRFGPIHKILALDSGYLKSLETFQTLAPDAVVTTIASLHDLVVYPDWTCHLDGARPVRLERLSHLGLMTEARALDEIETALGAPVDPGEPLGSLKPPGVG